MGSTSGYWAKGMGFTGYGAKDSVYADLTGEDDEGNTCYGNSDGKVTLDELYKYAAPPIYEGLRLRGKEKDNYPQVYPKDESFVIFEK